MMSNCLAIIKYMETKNRTEALKKMQEVELHGEWMTIRDRKMMEEASPNVVVARTGRGNYHTIGEAVRKAPDMTLNRYVIRIKAGTYRENVVIPLETL
ncbi:hypothetical protein Acr_12g0011110 [Actinidia rufa]|uniref:Pectinesterase n=1 Tax=Actinidia rufa TaxID=165716 RepID=A0A7J0FIQ7_9ERIC|nr:hypothetical protein Acr_12g0011110 [Actinidia rufa]